MPPEKRRLKGRLVGLSKLLRQQNINGGDKSRNQHIVREIAAALGSSGVLETAL